MSDEGGAEVGPDEPRWSMTRERGRVPDPEEAGPVGPFPSWSWVYGTVLVYGVLVIGLLTLFTRLLDPGIP